MSLNGTQVSRPSMGTNDRKLRYRTILEDLSNLEDEDGNNITRMDKASGAVKEAQALLAESGVEELVKHPGEGYLDSRVLLAASELTVRCAEAVSGNVNTYDKHELATHIKENPEFWEFTFPNEVPSGLCLLGTFLPTPAEARPRVARRRVEAQTASLTAPEALDRLEKVEEGSEMVSRVNSYITKTFAQSGRSPLSYFHVVLDPKSFCRTVENIYYVSFLVRDGMISIHLDQQHELPVITPIPPSERQQQDTRDIAEENQFIESIDMPRWKELINAFKITKPLMTLKRI